MLIHTTPAIITMVFARRHQQVFFFHPSVENFYRKCEHRKKNIIKNNLPASDERWLKPRFISCLPIFGCSKLFCEVSLLPLEDVDSFGEFCCCCGLGSGDFLQLRRNFVRKPLSGGYAGYYRPLMRTHPRLFSLLLYQIPVGMVKKRVGNRLSICTSIWFYK